ISAHFSTLPSNLGTAIGSDAVLAETGRPARAAGRERVYACIASLRGYNQFSRRDPSMSVPDGCRNMTRQASPRQLSATILAAVTLTLLPATNGIGQETNPSPKFFAKHCQTCHEGQKPKGRFRLDSLTADFADKANRERWLAVMEQ